MKKIIILSLLATCVISATGQDKENIVISIVSPQQIDNLDASQTTQLGKILLDIAVKSGLANINKTSGVIMYPVFTLISEDKAEGGMRNLAVIGADISFVIKHIESEIVFATYNLQVRGSGTTRQQAINAALSNISVKGADFDRFIISARRKIQEYYTANCSTIQMTAQSYAQQQDYEVAIALLASIPDATPCYAQALKTLETFYRDYQKQQCNELVQQAHFLYSGHQYLDALSVLQDLKVFDTNCSQEAKALSAKIETKLTAEEKREWDFAVQQEKSRITIAAKRIEAVQTIATAFFNRKIINYNYSLF
jgi:hypothetical protein